MFVSAAAQAQHVACPAGDVTRLESLKQPCNKGWDLLDAQTRVFRLRSSIAGHHHLVRSAAKVHCVQNFSPFSLLTRYPDAPVQEALSLQLTLPHPHHWCGQGLSCFSQHLQAFNIQKQAATHQQQLHVVISALSMQPAGTCQTPWSVTPCHSCCTWKWVERFCI
jgi:hypothetical protein